MKVILQRVLSSSVEVNHKIVGKIDQGLTLLIGFHKNDDTTKLDKMIQKIIHLRIFDDSNHVMNQSVLDISGQVLSVSQFTLYADTKRGNRPSYSNAMEKDKAIQLYNEFNRKLGEYLEVQTGIFGSNMKLKIENDGPVTIVLEE